MPLIGEEHKISIFQYLLSMNVVRSTCVGHSFRVFDRGEVHRHYAMGIVGGIIAEPIHCSAAVIFIDGVHRFVGIHNFVPKLHEYLLADNGQSSQHEVKGPSKCQQTLRSVSQKHFRPSSTTQRNR